MVQGIRDNDDDKNMCWLRCVVTVWDTRYTLYGPSQR